MGGVSREGDADDHGMFQAAAKGRVGAMEITTGETFLEGSCSGKHAIEFHGGTGGSAGNLEGFSARGRERAGKQQAIEKQMAGERCGMIGSLLLEYQ